MIIEASVRPRNVKRGVSTKALAQALGFDDEVGLTKMVGRIELSAEHPQEFAFLCALFNAFSPIKDQRTRIAVELDGKLVCAYGHNGASPDSKETE